MALLELVGEVRLPNKVGLYGLVGKRLLPDMLDVEPQLLIQLLQLLPLLFLVRQ